MGWVGECEEVRVVEGLQQRGYQCASTRGDRKEGLAHISGTDPLPGLIDDAFAEEV